MKKNPLVSVIVSAYNAEDKIERCIKAILSQNYKPLELTVVDDGSTDNTKKIIKKFADNKKVFLLEQNRQGPGAAKNLASKKAKGKILVFVDSDEYPKKDYLEKLTKPIRERKAKTSIGAWVVAYPENPWARCRFPDTYKLRHHAIKSGVFRAIDKTFFDSLGGGFNITKGYSDDRIPNNEKRARVDEAIFEHDVDSSAKEIFKKRKWIGSSIKTNPKPFRFWIKLIFGLLISAFFISSFWINLWITSGILLFALLVLFIQSLEKVIFYNDPRLFFYYPAYLIICFIGMLLGFLKPVYKNKT